MGVLSTIAHGLWWAGWGGRRATSAADELWSQLLGGYEAKSGVAVSADSALRVATVLACCRVLAEGIAQLPFKLMRDDDDRRVPARDHDLFPILWRRPNEWQTSFEFRETLMYHAALTFNGYAWINRVGGRVAELLPIEPHRVTPRQDRNYRLVYEIRLPDREMIVLPRSDVLHIRGPSWNGFAGMDAMRLAREAIGLAIATEESQARLHRNGTRPSGIVSITGGLSDKARERLRAQLRQMSGTENAFKTLIVDQGAKFERITMSGVDSQHIETRQHQIEEICRTFRVFPQMVGFSDKTATYASAEQFFTAHVIHSLGPWIERIEQAFTRDLLSEADVTGGYYPKLAVQGLLRGDAKARAEFYASGIVNGWLTRNDARRLEDLDPLPGLDEPLLPLNMIEASALGERAARIAARIREQLAAAGADLLALPGELESVVAATLMQVQKTPESSEGVRGLMDLVLRLEA